MSEHEKDEKHSEKVEVVIVVSGQPERLKVKADERLEHVVHEALKKTGNQGQPSSEWELRTEDGRLLDQSQTVAEAGIHSGMTLFLSPTAGAGGCGIR